MNSISIPLQENNLAEVLAGLAAIGIVEAVAPGRTTAVWQSNNLVINTPLNELEVLESIHSFLKDMGWNQGFGKVHQGVFSSSGHVGISPFMDYDNAGEPSVFKNFSGQVTTANICAEQIEAIRTVPRVSVPQYVSHTVRNVSSWGFDWRTNSHSLDLGFSANDDKTSCFDPVFIAIEMLSISALAFFLPAGVLSTSGEQIMYHIWKQPIPGSLTSAAFLGRINGINRQTYQVTRRPKSYGKGASYKYFPNANPVTRIQN